MVANAMVSCRTRDRIAGAALIVLLLLASSLGAQAPQQGRGGRGARGAQPGLEPRILSFEAKPTTVQAGEPAVLVWQTENPAGGVTIDPQIGAVTARGTRQSTPAS